MWQDFFIFGNLRKINMISFDFKCQINLLHFLEYDQKAQPLLILQTYLHVSVYLPVYMLGKSP